MKALLALLALGLLGIGIAACGGSKSSNHAASAVRASSTASTPTPDATSPAAASPVEVSAPAHPATRSDREKYDRDEDDSNHVPDDNNPAPPGFVSAAPADAAAATALVKRYYAAALKEDGTSGCSMLAPSFEQAIPLDYGKLGPHYLRRAAGTCPAVMSLLFKHEHRLLAHEVPEMDVVRVSVHGEQGDAFLRFGPLHERYIPLSRSGNAWKISAVLDGELE